MPFINYRGRDLVFYDLISITDFYTEYAKYTTPTSYCVLRILQAVCQPLYYLNPYPSHRLISHCCLLPFHQLLIPPCKNNAVSLATYNGD